jgi:tubulin epsilon
VGAQFTTNLVPYPRMHFLSAALAPLQLAADVSAAPRGIDPMFAEAFGPHAQLAAADPRRGMHLACALLLRGGIGMGDVARNLARLKPDLRMVHWNPDGFKVRRAMRRQAPTMRTNPAAGGRSACARTHRWACRTRC